MHRVLTLAVVAALSLAACSGSESAEDESADDESAPTTTLTPADATASPTAPTSVSPPSTTSATPTTSTTPDSAPSSAPTAPTTTTSTPPPGSVSRDDLVRFVAATESVLEGTPNEGVVHDDPDIYIAIGQVACARLTAGDSFEEVSNDLLTGLASASPDDDNRLVGAILGAATQTICPEHAGLS